MNDKELPQKLRRYSRLETVMPRSTSHKAQHQTRIDPYEDRVPCRELARATCKQPSQASILGWSDILHLPHTCPLFVFCRKDFSFPTSISPNRNRESSHNHVR